MDNKIDFSKEFFLNYFFKILFKLTVDIPINGPRSQKPDYYVEFKNIYNKTSQSNNQLFSIFDPCADTISSDPLKFIIFLTKHQIIDDCKVHFTFLKNYPPVGNFKYIFQLEILNQLFRNYKNKNSNDAKDCYLIFIFVSF